MSWNTNISGVLNELGTDGAVCSRKMASGRTLAGVIRSLVNARDLQPECPRVLHETLFVHVLIFLCMAILCREKGRSRIKPVQMYNLE